MSLMTPARLLSELDHVRIRRLLPAREVPQPLAELLNDADLVPPQAVPPDRATMGSRLLLVDVASGGQCEFTLCYPAEADPARGRISVLSPAGTSLLGLSVGGEARWQMPDGRWHAVRLQALLFQPEASGQYTM